MKMLALVFGLGLSTIGLAGNGSSGGGHIYGDKLNPWFLQNTKTVNYCVEIAPEFSQLSRAEVLTIVERSFSHWKSIFKNYNTHYITEFENVGKKVLLATQDFILEEKCTSSTDVKFQFGFLTTDQKKVIDYKQLIGLAERTDYDSVNLKGKGFIYIAAESGEFRPTSSNFHSAPWSFGKKKILQFVLHHEIGHLFGLQDGFYDSAGIMDAHIAERLTDKKLIQLFDKQITTPSVFGCDDDLKSEYEVDYSFSDENGPISSSDPLIKFLGLTGSYYKLRFASTATGLSILDLTHNHLIGQINYKRIQVSDDIQSDAISLYLTKSQTVFANLPARFLNSYVTVYVRTTSRGFKSEELVLTNGNKMNVFVKFDADCFATTGGVFDDLVYFDLFGGL